MKVSPQPQEKRKKYSREQHFKKWLEERSPNFAWEVMMLEINIEESSQPNMEQIMKLMQLYMLAVEVLESNNDSRFKYFNSKIYTLMSKRQVIQQLQRATTISPLEPETLAKIEQQQLDIKKSILEMQVSLQKEAFTPSLVKDILKKNQSLYNHREQRIHQELVTQNEVLEGRIRNRRLKSVSKGKQVPPKSTPTETRATYKLRKKIDDQN